MPARKPDALIREKFAKFRREAKRSTVLTGPFFDEPFFAIPTPPPWAHADPCWKCWKSAEHYGSMLKRCTESSSKKLTAEQIKECDKLRASFFKAARSYAYCMDQHYGISRMKPD